ncbi:hypothetical protein [Bellilinea sp.]|uniref:hypothetical protein n=1 Tax=Bellilinea sp. TaxID=2838785 RepID=UPI002ADD89DC|nr:hypothetical protein [Bellilinea sp.]
MKRSQKATIGWLVLLISAICLFSSTLQFLLNRTIPKTSANPHVLSQEQIQLMRESNHLIELVGNQVFPGWGDFPTAWVFYNENTAFVSGLIPEQTSLGWEMYPRKHQRGGKWEEVSNYGHNYFRTPLQNSQETPENFIVKVGNQLAASFQTNEFALIYMHNLMYSELPPILREIFPYRLFFKDLFLAPEAYISSLAHEAFHVFQARTNPAMFERAELISSRADQYPFDNEAMLASWKEELEILSRSAEISNREQALQIATTFLEHREERRTSSQLSNPLIEYERQREWLEGMAKYAELELGKIAAQQDFQPLNESAKILNLENYSSRERFWHTQLSTMHKTNMDGETLFYYSGFAQGVLLDYLMPGWKERALQGESLEELLAESIKK